MTKITKETVEKIARLSELKFDSAELEKYTQKFSRVLEYVEQLNKVDTTGIEPTSHAMASTETKLREDAVEKFDNVDGILSNAPKKDGRFIEVPKVIE